MHLIFEERRLCTGTLKRPKTLPHDHPSKIQSTIVHTQPDETTSLVRNNVLGLHE